MNTHSKNPKEDKFQEYLNKSRQRRKRIRSIFIEMRKLFKYSDWSDISILNYIVSGLKEQNLPFSKNEIYSVFSAVNIDDYAKEEKRPILKNLLRSSEKTSIFNK